jgi:tetratricopeptide (TPR) repeat protein
MRRSVSAFPIIDWTLNCGRHEGAVRAKFNAWLMMKARTKFLWNGCSVAHRRLASGGLKVILCWLLLCFWMSTSVVNKAAAFQVGGQSATGSQSAPSVIGELPFEEDKDDLPILEVLESSIVNQKFQQVTPGLKDYLKAHPESARGYYDLGYVYFRTHQLGPAVTELSTSLRLNVKNAEAHKILGLVCNYLGRYDLAETELEDAARLKPESAEIHYFLGRFYYFKGVYPLAKKEFESAIQLNPTYMKAHNNLGLTMEVLGNNAAALENYTMAVRLDEEQKLNSEWPYVYLSAMYNRQEKPDQALEYGQKALEKDPKSDLAYFQMAKAYRTKGEWEKSADASRHAIAINPKTPDFYFVLSYVLRKLGKNAESQQAMDMFKKLQEQDAAKAERRITNRDSGKPSMAMPDDE